MSDDWLRVIPTDPAWAPSADAARHADAPATIDACRGDTTLSANATDLS